MTTTNLWDVAKGISGGFWDVEQIISALKGQNDIGAIQAFQQIAAPGAPTVAVNATSGNLTGNYTYAVAFLTGYLQGDPQNPGAGTLHILGNTGGGTSSAVVSPNGQQVNLSNIPIGGTGVVARAIYRTKAGGSTFYFLQQINDNVTTSWPDNVADANLGAIMPASNTTGSWFQGKFIGTDPLIPFQWPVLTTLPAVGPAGTVILYKSPSGTISLYGSDGTSWNQISGGGTTADFYEFTASAGQTVITLPGGKAYTPGTNTLQVYIAGDRQAPGTFTEANSTQVNLNTALTGGEDVMLYWFKQLPSGQGVPVATATTVGGIKPGTTLSTAADGTTNVVTGQNNGVAGLDASGNVPLSQLGNVAGQEYVASYTANAGQTVFTLPNGETYTPGQHAMNVFIRGAFQDPNSAFTETSSTQVTLSAALNGGEDVVLRWYKTTPAAIQSLPIATQTSVGSVKGSSTLNVAADGTANVVTGGNNGVAGLDASGNVPLSQLSNVPAPPPVNAATTTALGTVEVTHNMGGTPITPTRVAKILEQLLADTNLDTVLTFTPTVAGLFEIPLYARVVTAATTLTIQITYTSAGGAQTETPVNATSMGVGEYGFGPYVIASVANQPITVKIQAGTANQVYASGSILGV